MNKPILKPWKAPMIIQLNSDKIKSGTFMGLTEYAISVAPGCMKALLNTVGTVTVGGTGCS